MRVFRHPWSGVLPAAVLTTRDSAIFLPGSRLGGQPCRRIQSLPVLPSRQSGKPENSAAGRGIIGSNRWAPLPFLETLHATIQPFSDQIAATEPFRSMKLTPIFASTLLLLPQVISHAAVVIYADDFSGLAAADLRGTAPDVGGNTWLGTNNFKASGSVTAGAGSITLPFSPVAGNIYELSANLAFTTNDTSWIGVGFADASATWTGLPALAIGNRFTGSVITGYSWMISAPDCGPERLPRERRDQRGDGDPWRGSLQFLGPPDHYSGYHGGELADVLLCEQCAAGNDHRSGFTAHRQCGFQCLQRSTRQRG